MPRLEPATKSARRQDLVDAAWRCVAERGFQSLTVDDVCSEAGVSKGAFYVYFDQKRDLFVALLDDEAAEIETVMQHLDDADLPSVERLTRFARSMAKLGEDPARVQIRADLWAEVSTDPGLRERSMAVVRARRAVLRRWVEDGVASGELDPIPANALAAILLALGDGLSLHAGLDPTAFRWGNVVRAVEALLDGIRRS